MPSPSSSTAWIESLSPWPADGFGLDRMRALLHELGDPQLAYPSIHVVGTNGKGTTTRMMDALLEDAGLRVGSYYSPHATDWSERIRVLGGPADFEAAVARVRPACERLGATQFESLTAAALAEFAAAEVDAAVVEAGLGGRHDATNVLDTRVVVLTNVALEHTEVLGSTREEIAAEKLAVVRPGCTVVLGEPEWEPLARSEGAEAVVVAGRSSLALATAAAESFLGHTVDPHAAEDVALPGRLEHRGDAPLEIWDGAHNIAGVGWLLARLPSRHWVILCAILADKQAEKMLRALSVLGDTLVATETTSSRSLPAAELAGIASPLFESVSAEPDPGAASRRARELAGPQGALLVTGSLTLLADLYKEETAPWRTSATR
jgi:dihydrofolate synthase / folylpolyglutamate synthase